MQWVDLVTGLEGVIASTFKHGHRAVCSGVLIGGFLDILEVEARAVVSVGNVVEPVTEGPQRAARGWLARHSTSIRWAGLIARTFGHGHRAACGGGRRFEVVEEHVLLPANRADTESAGECK